MATPVELAPKQVLGEHVTIFAKAGLRILFTPISEHLSEALKHTQRTYTQTLNWLDRNSTDFIINFQNRNLRRWLFETNVHYPTPPTPPPELIYRHPSLDGKNWQPSYRNRVQPLEGRVDFDPRGRLILNGKSANH